MRSISQGCTPVGFRFLVVTSWHRETNRSCYWANSQARYALLTNAVIKFVFCYRRRFFNLCLTSPTFSLPFARWHSSFLSFALELPSSFVSSEGFTNTKKSKINCSSSWQPDFTLFSSSIYPDWYFISFHQPFNHNRSQKQFANIEIRRVMMNLKPTTEDYE